MSGGCGLYYSYVLRDSIGRLKSKDRRPAESFVIGFLNILYNKLGLTTYGYFKDTSGNSAIRCATSRYTCNAVANLENTGLVVGTGTTAVAISDNCLVTQVRHGTGSGQLQYGISTVGLPASDALGTSLILTRDFSNASGATITVKEIGIYASYLYPGVSPTNRICFARDLATIALANGDQLTLNYELRTNL